MWLPDFVWSVAPLLLDERVGRVAASSLVGALAFLHGVRECVPTGRDT